jgi:Stress responsive A/B Barrel Domain
MILHVVAFKWKPGIPEGHVESVKSQLVEFAATLPEVKSYRCGADEGASQIPNFDFAIVAEFDTIDDWKVYDKHPRHDEIRSGVVKPWIETRASVQFES